MQNHKHPNLNYNLPLFEKILKYLLLYII